MPPGKFLGQGVEEYLKAFRVGCGQDQKCARPVRGADGPVEIDVFRISWEATSGLTPAGAQHGRGRFILPNRASSANITRKGRPLAAATRRAFLTSS